MLLDKAIDSLILSVEHFNRANEQGRTTSVLILLDHAFEMLLKAAILHRGGRIREKRARETIGFDACVRRALSDGEIKFLTDEQALTLQSINGLRDAAQHHLIDIAEEQLYIHAQSGVTLFGDILKKVFGEELSSRLPARVLPVSTVAPVDLQTLFQKEAEEIRKLLRPGKRRMTEAYARLRPLAILDATIRGEKLQPSAGELHGKAKELSGGKTWEDVFSGAASITLTKNGAGHAISLRITKKEGIPVQLVPEGTPGASVVAVKRVNELGFYNMGRDQLAMQLGLSGVKASAAIWRFDVQKDPECFLEVKIGKTVFKRYSQRAIERIREGLATKSIEAVWADYKQMK
ncbi:MAG TPA: DUF3644 domain-containing protein [Candidatus Acidoferrales bacterium]|nr:DUF3644 domain-containing protein [Candidatus Acidoferrales bacterium]